MIDHDKLKRVAERAAKVAEYLLGIQLPYSVSLINDSSHIQDGLFGTERNEIKINLTALEPYPPESLPIQSVNPTDEEIQQNEFARYALKTVYIVFHEMRHLYQIQAVSAYALNLFMGGGIKLPESAKKCSQWQKELETYNLNESAGTDIEEDAEAFATYLIHRYPVNIKMRMTNRRIGGIKRKYDKINLIEERHCIDSD